MPELELVDPTTNPHLSGRFAPIHREITESDLRIEGDLPADLAGAYLRNGPNPKFPPLGSYTYPMEGDGMLHGLWFDGGSVRYKNRWVETNSLKAEERAGKALFGGLLTPAYVDQSLLGPDPDPGWPSKLDTFINVVHHNGRYLALEEGSTPYAVTADLETVGRYDFGGGLPKGITAHPKIDPVTGDMVVFRYDFEAPFLTWAVVAPDGSMKQPETPIDSVDTGYMIHDCALTETYLVITLGPAVFDIDAMLAGGSLLAWKPELGSRIALVPRDGVSPTTWIETDAFWVWHFANAHDVDGTVQMSFPRWTVPGFLVPDVANACDYVSAVVDPAKGTIDMTTLHTATADFPRVDDRLIGRPNRFAVLTAQSTTATALAPGEHDALCRVDLREGAWQQFETGSAVGEPVFAPRPDSTHELDGYYLAYMTSLADDHTVLGIWDAADFPGPPRAEVHLPQRVPNGLHGNWFPAA